MLLSLQKGASMLLKPWKFRLRPKGWLGRGKSRLSKAVGGATNG